MPIFAEISGGGGLNYVFLLMILINYIVSRFINFCFVYLIWSSGVREFKICGMDPGVTQSNEEFEDEVLKKIGRTTCYLTSGK